MSWNCRGLSDGILKIAPCHLSLPEEEIKNGPVELTPRGSGWKSTENGGNRIKLFVGIHMAFPELIRREVDRSADNMALIVFVPIIGDHTFVPDHFEPGQCPGVRGHHRIGAHVVVCTDIKLHRFFEYRGIILIKSEDEETEDQNPVTVNLFHEGSEGVRLVHILVDAFKGLPGNGFKADTEHEAPALSSEFQQLVIERQAAGHPGLPADTPAPQGPPQPRGAFGRPE